MYTKGGVEIRVKLEGGKGARDEGRKGINEYTSLLQSSSLIKPSTGFPVPIFVSGSKNCLRMVFSHSSVTVYTTKFYS
jgi:hypothetical protein